MRKFLMAPLAMAFLLFSTNAFAITAIEVYEKLAKVDALFTDLRINKAELARSLSEAKAAKESYDLTHKDKLVPLFSLAAIQFSAAKAELEAANTTIALEAARETMGKIRAMIRKK